MSASLAVVQASGLGELDLDMDVDEDGSPKDDQMGQSPTGASSPGSPWSPVTPAVVGKRESLTGPSPGSGNVRRVQVLSGANISPSPVRKIVLTPTQAKNICSTGGQPLSKGRVSFGAPVSIASPGGAINAQSPGAIIRQNAVSLGIPLHLRGPGVESAAPVPVRSAQGKIHLPSPSTTGAPRRVVKCVNGSQQQQPQQQQQQPQQFQQNGPPPAFLRSIVTPQLSKRFAKAAGGA